MLSHSTSSDFLTVCFFFSFLVFSIKLAATHSVHLEEPLASRFPPSGGKKAKEGFMQQSEAAGSNTHQFNPR